MVNELLDIKSIHPAVMHLMAWMANHQSYPIHVFCDTQTGVAIRAWVEFMMTGGGLSQPLSPPPMLTTGLVPPMHHITNPKLCMCEADSDVMASLDTRPTHFMQQWSAALDITADTERWRQQQHQQEWWQRWCSPEFQALVDGMLQAAPDSSATVTDVALAQFAQSQCVFAPSACVPLREFREGLARSMGSDAALRGPSAVFLAIPAVQRWLATHNIVVPDRLSNRQWQGRKVHTQFMCGVTVVACGV